MMSQVFNSAMGAAKAAHYFSCILRRPVMRHMTLSKHGVPLWVVSFDIASHNALQEL